MTYQNANRFALVSRAFANLITLCGLLTVVAVARSFGGELTVNVVGSSGKPVNDVVVTASATAVKAAAAPSLAVMDQRQLAFVPRILVVAVGQSVQFPNSDSVSHQVYSFSPAKKFQLPLYKGERHPPVTFDQEGLVVLGCNIHDQMVGYIYVTAAPFYGQTDDGGAVRLHDLPAGEYTLTVWSPLIADGQATLVRTVRIEAVDSKTERVQLTRPLRTRPEPRPRRGDWEY